VLRFAPVSPVSDRPRSPCRAATGSPPGAPSFRGTPTFRIIVLTVYRKAALVQDRAGQRWVRC